MAARAVQGIQGRIREIWRACLSALCGRRGGGMSVEVQDLFCLEFEANRG